MSFTKKSIFGILAITILSASGYYYVWNKTTKGIHKQFTDFIQQGKSKQFQNMQYRFSYSDLQTTKPWEKPGIIIDKLTVEFKDTNTKTTGSIALDGKTMVAVNLDLFSKSSKDFNPLEIFCKTEGTIYETINSSTNKYTNKTITQGVSYHFIVRDGLTILDLDNPSKVSDNLKRKGLSFILKMDAKPYETFNKDNKLISSGTNASSLLDFDYDVKKYNKKTLSPEEARFKIRLKFDTGNISFSKEYGENLFESKVYSNLGKLSLSSDIFIKGDFDMNNGVGNIKANYSMKGGKATLKQILNALFVATKEQIAALNDAEIELVGIDQGTIKDLEMDPYDKANLIRQVLLARNKLEINEYLEPFERKIPGFIKALRAMPKENIQSIFNTDNDANSYIKSEYTGSFKRRKNDPKSKLADAEFDYNIQTPKWSADAKSEIKLSEENGRRYVMMMMDWDITNLDSIIKSFKYYNEAPLNLLEKYGANVSELRSEYNGSMDLIDSIVEDLFIREGDSSKLNIIMKREYDYLGVEDISKRGILLNNKTMDERIANILG